MKREPNDPIDDVGTWNQPLTGKRVTPAATGVEPTDGPIFHATNETPMPSGEKSFTPSETPEHSGDTTDNDSKNPPVPKQSHTRAVYGSSEWDTTPPPLIAKGEVLFGKYRLDEQIGEGGMGSVWKVWHVDMECERALKLIKPEIAQNDKGWRRFRREAQLMDRIKHPCAVRVYDYKRTQGLGYIEMEFVRGRSLEQILKSNGNKPMPLDWTVQVVEQLCAVLQEAHGHVDDKTGAPKPIVHRDLKPSNLMLIESKHQDETIRLKVLDFGIAKMIEDDGGTEQTVTAAGDILGTPAYMSPEQIKGGFEKEEGKPGLDGRSDLYSTGVVLYHLLTGVRPFRGSSMVLIGAHLNSQPPPMKEANPEANVPPEIERVVLQCLEKEPAKRPQTARELSEKFLRAAGQSSRQPSFLSSLISTTSRKKLATGGPSRPVQWPSRGDARPRKRLVAGLGAAASAILLAGLVGSMMWSSRVPSSGETGKNEPIPAPESKVVPAWIPDGYEAVSDERAADSPQDVLKLRRQTDGVVFVRWPEKPGVYIPDGYVAEFSDSASPDMVTRLTRKAGGAKFDRVPWGVYLPAGYEEVPGDRIVSWPSALVRSKDKVKFIRIAGGTYLRGDPGDVPEEDSEGAPCTPHFVRVPSFYIQETEVTDGEIEDYIKADAEQAKDLKDWNVLFSTLCGDNAVEEKNRARRFPATYINYWTARKYAASVQGQLPTEAEWEYACRSRSQSNVYSYGAVATDQDQPLKANLYNANQRFGKSTGAPQPVDGEEFAEDATQQHVLGMTGNVQEFCADVYKPYGQLDLTKNSSSDPLIDRRAEALPKGDDFKVVVKGGSFMLKQSRAKAFLRYTLPVGDHSDSIGFRVVIECPPEDWPLRSQPSDPK